MTQLQNNNDMTVDLVDESANGGKRYLHFDGMAECVAYQQEHGIRIPIPTAKKTYRAPRIERMECKVERGFAGSGSREGTSEPIADTPLGPIWPLDEGKLDSEGRRYN